MKKATFKPILLLWDIPISLQVFLFVICAGLPVLAAGASSHPSPTAHGTGIRSLLDHEISGTVLDTSGVPLAGVSIVLKGSPSTATSTDENGRFILDLPANQGVLMFSSVGYEPHEENVKGRTRIEVRLIPSSTVMDDVVVVAFSRQKKTDLVGSVTSVKPGDLKIPGSNLTTAFAGQIAGMIAYQRSGEPGEDNASFFIRGVTTFGYKVDPLILIDGVELTTLDLARLQPDDIESFSILKDATATALYGARGANGVILVATKEGKEGKAKVSVRVENSFSAPTTNVQLADPVTYMKLHNEAILTRDPLGRLPYQQKKIDATEAGGDPYLYPANDWRKMLFKDYTMNQRANFNVSGGGAVARYYFAGTYNQDNGMLKVDNRNNFNTNIDLKSYLIRSNINVNITKSLEVGVRLYGSFDDYTGPIDGGTGMYNKVMRSNPALFPAYYPVSEEYQYIDHILFGNTSLSNDYINPYADMVRGYRDYSRSLMMAQFEIKQDLQFLTPGLSFRALGSTNRRSYFDVTRSYLPFFYTADPFFSSPGDYRLSALNENTGTEYLDYTLGDKIISSTFYLESAIDYQKTFNEKHGVSSMLVYIMRQSLDADADDLQQSLPSKNLGLSGRFTYSYDSRYFGEFNFGYNGSERFHEKHRFGFFPSAGIAWNISNEKFWSPIKPTFNMLKIRATYGYVGNDAIGSPADRFFYLSNLNMRDAARGASFGSDYEYYRDGISISRYDNPDITWEIAEKLNLGIELGLLNKIDIQADFFTEKRTNILMTRESVPTTMGLSSAVRANVGEASSKGMDLSVDYRHSFGPDFWLSTRGNFTYATNKYLVFEEPQYPGQPYLSRVGYGLSQQWGYIADHLFVDDNEVKNSPRQHLGQYAAGDIKYLDISGDGQITTLDQVPIGNPTVPEIVYGFGFSLGYKRFDVSCFFQGLAQESFWIDPQATAPFIGHKQLLKAYADNYWSENNRNSYALWPRLSTQESDNNMVRSTWFMQDGTFLRLKSAEIGYTVRPKDTAKRLGIDNLRIYASGTNLLLWSKFKHWDVEMAGDGLGYPIQRVFNMGIMVSL
ncbi:SusC/RagA family TonB-linked outer membrane protein [Parapedobacter sp. 2B3]|uniref:SusC/RagA family TonB-linked outer membrane protein n=1 Tax=Parapedobacter sp. 2B3 TaxID=3342381 RepID=UPI0035B66488